MGDEEMRILSNPSVDGEGGGVKVSASRLGESYEQQKERLWRIKMGQINLLHEGGNTDNMIE